jgi:hypothetical protein
MTAFGASNCTVLAATGLSDLVAAVRPGAFVLRRAGSAPDAIVRIALRRSWTHVPSQGLGVRGPSVPIQKGCDAIGDGLPGVLFVVAEDGAGVDFQAVHAPVGVQFEI